MFSILKGETTAQEAVCRHGLAVADVESWRDKFLAEAENALRSRPRDEEGRQAEYMRRLERKVGRMALDMDNMKAAMRPCRPFDERAPEGS